MITHRGTQTIKTERLVLRKFAVDDALDMYNNWASDEMVTKFLTWSPHESPEATKQLLKGWCEGYKKPDTYNWAMEYNGNVIGSISVVSINERSEYADMGYCMSRDCWNKGLMTEAVKAVADYLFSQVGINRIGISYAVKNPASGRVAQKCGFTFEGTRREYFKNSSGELLDISFYGLLKREWESMHR